MPFHSYALYSATKNCLKKRNHEKNIFCGFFVFVNKLTNFVENKTEYIMNEPRFADYGVFEIYENSSNKKTFYLRSVYGRTSAKLFNYYFRDLFFFNKKRSVSVLTYSKFADEETKEKYKNHEKRTFYLYRERNDDIYMRGKKIPKVYIPDDIVREMLGYDVNMPKVNINMEITVVKLNKDDESKFYEN